MPREAHGPAAGESRGPEWPSRAQEFVSRALCAFVVCASVAASLGGCKQIPAGSEVVDHFVLDGVPPKNEAEIAEGLSTRASPLFLGFWEGVYEYETFDEAALQKDLERVERQMRRRGYYEAKVRAARVVRTDEQKVRVEIQVEPGEQVRIGQLETTGLAALPFDAAERAARAMSLERGNPFDEDDYERAQLDVANALADVGYAFVRVNGKARIDLTEHRASVALDVTPGPRSTFGDIAIEGLVEVPEGPVRAALLLEKGDFYSRSELEYARTALFQLGVFSKVDVTQHTENPESGVVPITIRVEESPLRNITAGVGAKLDVQRLAVYGRLGWTHRNFLGGLRKLSLSTRPGITLFPTRVDYLEQLPTAVLPENALTARLEQPALFEGRTLGFVETNYNVYPLLYPLPAGVKPENERIIGYNELTAAVGLTRNFWGRVVPVTLSMNWRSNFPFTYQGALNTVCAPRAGEADPRLTAGNENCGMDPVIVTYPELLTGLDLRDDPISPTRGIYLSNNFQIGLPVLGGVVEDVRLKPEVRAFYPLDNARRLVLAARVTVGMVFPSDYGDALIDGVGRNPRDPDVIRDQQKLLFRAFYSGGPDSNRGYPYQRIGPQGPIGFLLPDGEDCTARDAPATCIRPLGGFSMWEASLELRWKFAPPWGLVFFADASDVRAGTATFDTNRPHLSIGPGLRYASPVGPIRLDLGWRVPGLQNLARLDASNPNAPANAPSPALTRPDISEVLPYSTEPWWQAFALHILIGEAF